MTLFHSRCALWMKLFRLRFAALGRYVAKGSKSRSNLTSVRFLDGRAASAASAAAISSRVGCGWRARASSSIWWKALSFAA